MLKKHYLITKITFQIILYLIEMIGVSYLLTKIIDVYLPTENFLDFLERMIMFFTFYQIIVLGILQQLNDIKKDYYFIFFINYNLKMV